MPPLLALYAKQFLEIKLYKIIILCLLLDNCSTLYYSIYCCKKKDAALLLYAIRSYFMSLS